MGTTVDSLEIQLQMQSQKASSSIDTLIDKLGTLNTSITKINGSGLSGVANGVDKLSRSMNGLKNVGAADYARLAKGIEKISNLDSSQISKAATAIVGFGKGLQSLNSVNVSGTSEQVAALANGIKQLGYKSSTNAIENIPKLASAMRQLMSELSKAPKVSQNLIDMTNALAKLSRTGAASGRAANALGGGLNNYTKATHNASRGTKGLASALGKMYATYWLLFRAIGKIGDSITIASDLVEVQNVVDTVFGNMSSKVEEYAQKSIEQFGMSELSFKQYASRFQSMGAAMGIDTSSIESANAFLNKSTSGYVGLSNSMADVSLTLTQLTADMASFYNVSQKDVAEDLAAIFTGETRPLRTYGLDLTQATLAEWAMKQGLDANVQSMSQAEKTMLRYQYVLANTTAAQGDFARTSNTWANQIRILQEQIKKFASVIGTGFIAAFKPFVQTLNKVMAKVIDFTQNVLNALGQIFGWEFEISGGGITDDLGADLSESMGDVSTGTGNAAGNAGDLSDNLGNAVENAKKLKTLTLGIDELNINAPQDDKATGGGSSGGGSGSGGGGTGGGTGSGGTGLTTTIKRNDKLLEAYKSNIKTLEQLGEYIGETLTNAMNKIPWNKVYEGARNFGKGLADFLNGLISPELFGATGRTIANSLNTAIYAALSFGETFDFYDFGVSIATGINEFFRNFDFRSLAETLNVWVDGLEEAVKGAIVTFDISAITDGLSEFFSIIELDTVLVVLGLLKFKKIKKWAFGKFEGFSVAGLFSAIFSGGISIGQILLNIGSIALGFSGTPVGDVTASWILDEIGRGLKKLIPNWVLDFLGNLGAGITLGAAAGSWFPGAGTVAGAIIGGIIGALNGIKIDGKSILKIIADKIFNFDSTNAFFEEAKKNFEKGGLYIILGIVDGIAGGLQFLVEPIQDLFSWIWEGICDVFGIHSPATSMYPIGENILFGILKGFESVWGEITNTFSEWYEKKIKPWFTIEKWRKLGENIENGFANIPMFFDGIWKSIKKVFAPAADWFKEKFEKAYQEIKNAWSFVTTWFSDKWKSIKNVFKDTKTWFGDTFRGAYDAVKNSWSFVTTWFSDKWKSIKNVFKDVRSWFSEAFGSAYDAVTKKWDDIKSYFKKVAGWILDPIEKAVNGVINGINWVFEKVGAKAPLKTWKAPKFASGSNGLPSDTIGVVNDQAGSTYKELIVPPHGKPFIPEGRNVMLPMEKGTKIMPAGQTKALMNGMPKFKNGIGEFFGNAWSKIKDFTGDVMDYITQPSKILQIAIDKFTDFSGITKFFIPLATGAVSKVFDSAVGFIKRMFDKTGGTGIEKALKWAVGIANDNSHGYDQAHRTGPDYDCSSLVTTALKNAGFPIGVGSTATMFGQLTSVGFKNVNGSVNKSTAGGMKRGDVLLTPGKHTAMYLGNGQLVHASINEFGRITGGKPGDQTGKEICVKKYYNFPWSYVLRYAKGFKNGIGNIGLSDLIPQYSVGGFPEDGLFMANHNELVGQFSDGRTAVANNLDIQKGIEDAAYRGFSRANAENREQENLLRELIQAVRDGKRIVVDGRELVSITDSRRARNGYSFT